MSLKAKYTTCTVCPRPCLQVELVGLSYIGLNAVVDFLYSGELPLDGGNIDYVLEAAHLLQVRHCVSLVQHAMLNIQHRLKLVVKTQHCC